MFIYKNLCVGKVKLEVELQIDGEGTIMLMNIFATHFSGKRIHPIHVASYNCKSGLWLNDSSNLDKKKYFFM